jgi:hemerythrin-like domain-containing protein
MHRNKKALPANAMESAIATLKGEHASFAIALKSLVGHLDYARSYAEQPKLHIFSTGLGFIETFVDHFHHPKEDELLFHALRKRTSEADDVLRELQYDHAHAESSLAELKTALANILSVGIAELSRFTELLNRYKDAQFAHMEREESIVIPLARLHITESGWREIDRGFRANRDPLFGARSGHFAALFQADPTAAG